VTHVPYVPSPPPVSPRAQELSRRLRETIDKYKQENPSVTALDIRQALSMSVPSGSVPRRVAVVAALGLAVLGGMVAFFLSSEPGNADVLKPVLIVALMVVIGVIVVVKSRSGPV